MSDASLDLDQIKALVDFLRDNDIMVNGEIVGRVQNYTLDSYIDTIVVTDEDDETVYERHTDDD